MTRRIRFNYDYVSTLEVVDVPDEIDCVDEILKSMAKVVEETPKPMVGPLQPFGIEKTFVTHKWGQDDCDIDNKVEEKHTLIAEEISRQIGDKVWRAGTDPGCVEIASMPMTSISEAKEFFNMTTELAVKKYRLRHKAPSVIGCGGHIHVQKPKDPEHASTMHKFAMMFPWMNAFGHPLDDMNLQSPGLKFLKNLINESDSIKENPGYYGNALSSRSIIQMCENLDFVREAVDHKKFTGEATWDLTDLINFARADGHTRHHKATIATRPNVGEFGTFEFRCFDAVENWAEQELHIQVAQAVFDYTKRMAGQLYAPSFVDMVEAVMAPPKTQLKMYHHMIKELGLPKALCKKYEANITPRVRMEQKEVANAMYMNDLVW